MDATIVSILAVTAGLTASLVVVLAVVKLFHREIERYRGVRTAYYTSAVGEMLSRGVLPSRPRQGWAEDPLFHDAVADYRLMVTGEDRRFVDSLVDKLGIGDILVTRARRRFPRSTRLRAVSSLVDLATPAHTAALQTMIDDPNPHVRVHAVRGLARVGDTGAVSHILDIATRVKPWEAARTADALVEMGADAVEPVINWVEHERSKAFPSVDVVALSGRLLGLIGDERAEPVLIALLGSDRPDWRVAAASALEHAGTDMSVEPLRVAIHDDDWRVRARAVVALGAMADDVAIEEIAQLLTDRQWWVRQNAAGALTQLPGGTDRLKAALEGSDHFAADAALNQLTISGALSERRPLPSRT
ncbi:MAG TPA: HEAT repeat domain-containing protein [Acidimicrobiia bacterium]|nr:HEAT repeat domain-containing protein [Acidimicrobiia bacterium]